MLFGVGSQFFYSIPFYQLMPSLRCYDKENFLINEDVLFLDCLRTVLALSTLPTYLLGSSKLTIPSGGPLVVLGLDGYFQLPKHHCVRVPGPLHRTAE